jgi:glycosyltransferase involved in cell wall biosynthesis
VRLAVIGDTQHYRDGNGNLCTLEPVANQLDRWAAMFDEVVLCAPLDDGPPPTGFAPYRATNVRIEPLPRAGGNTLLAKLGLVTHVVPWAWRTRRVARRVDAVHLRCPCNIGLVAIFSTWKAVPYRYALYAGVWHDYDGEPFFFRLQRKLLASRFFGGPVSVYASRRLDRPHLEPFFSPSFSIADWEAAAADAAAKVARITDPATDGPWRLVTVGRLSVNKNQQAVIRAVPRMVELGADVELEVLGDGPERPALERLAADQGVADRVRFRGSVSHGDVMDAFRRADLNLLSTRQEGYGKVLLEGMVHATVPVFAQSPVAGEIAGDGTRGIVFPADSPDVLAEAVAGLVADRVRWGAMAAASREYAATVTLEAFEQRVHELLERQWGVELPAPAGSAG